MKATTSSSRCPNLHDLPMIRRLLVQIAETLSVERSTTEGAESRNAALRLATAVLLVDVARADHVFDDSEFEQLLQLIEAHFGLTTGEATQLLSDANARADDLVSLHEFTALLHEHLSESEKAQIISMLWQVAYADGRLDKYEDSLILKISDLLYVSRGRVMRLKHDAASAAGADD